MTNAAVEMAGQRLATLCVGLTLPDNVPKFVLQSERVPPWWTLSVATVYLSFAKHWLSFLPVKDVWMAVDRCMDDCFFDFVSHTNFDVKVPEVIVHPSEQAAYCDWAHIAAAEFHRQYSDTQTLLNLVYANRCNQYTVDLRAGVIRELEGKPNSLGPVIFAFKRFNQHMYGVECDMKTIELSDDMRHISPLGSMFFDACVATQQCCADSAKDLPFSL